MKKIVIVGSGGFGKEVAWLIKRINAVEPTWDLIGFLDDNHSVHGTEVYGYPVLGGCEKIKELGEVWCVCAIGSGITRKKVIQKLESIVPVKYATLIDPSVLYSSETVVGEGSIICAHTILTVEIEIGRHVIINLDCTVGHGAIIHDFTTLYPSVNVSGDCVIEECVELGTGMQIIQGKLVGQNSILGAGAVVVKDIPAKCTAVGSPAKPIKFFE